MMEPSWTPLKPLRQYPVSLLWTKVLWPSLGYPETDKCNKEMRTVQSACKFT